MRRSDVLREQPTHACPDCGKACSVAAFTDKTLMERTMAKPGVAPPEVGVLMLDNGMHQHRDHFGEPGRRTHWKQETGGLALSMTSRLPVDTEVVSREVIASTEGTDVARYLEWVAWEQGITAAKRQAFVADGASSIWGIHKKYFRQMTGILDLMHACSYAYRAAAVLDEKGLVRRWARAIWQGRVGEVLAELTTHQDRLGLPTILRIVHPLAVVGQVGDRFVGDRVHEVSDAGEVRKVQPLDGPVGFLPVGNEGFAPGLIEAASVGFGGGERTEAVHIPQCGDTGAKNTLGLRRFPVVGSRYVRDGCLPGRFVLRNVLFCGALFCKRLISVMVARILPGEKRLSEPIVLVATVGHSQFNRAPQRIASPH